MLEPLKLYLKRKSDIEKYAQKTLQSLISNYLLPIKKYYGKISLVFVLNLKGLKNSCSFLTKANLKTQTKKQNIKLPLSSHQYSSLSTKFYHLEITRSFVLRQSFSAKSSVSRVMWRTRSIIYPAPQTELSKILLFSSHTSLLFDLIIISL